MFPIPATLALTPRKCECGLSPVIAIGCANCSVVFYSKNGVTKCTSCLSLRPKKCTFCANTFVPKSAHDPTVTCGECMGKVRCSECRFVFTSDGTNNGPIRCGKCVTDHKIRQYILSSGSSQNRRISPAVLKSCTGGQALPDGVRADCHALLPPQSLAGGRPTHPRRRHAGRHPRGADPWTARPDEPVGNRRGIASRMARFGAPRGRFRTPVLGCSDGRGNRGGDRPVRSPLDPQPSDGGPRRHRAAYMPLTVETRAIRTFPVPSSFAITTLRTASGI